MDFFLCNKHKTVVKWTTHQNPKYGDDQKHNWENFEIIDHKFGFWILKIIIFLADIGYLVQLLSNHWANLSPKNLEDISNIDGWVLTLVTYKKESVIKGKWKFLQITIIKYKLEMPKSA